MMVNETNDVFNYTKKQKNPVYPGHFASAVESLGQRNIL